MGKVAVARIKYDGNWDPEPGAWGRFGRLFQWQTNFGVGTRPVALKDLKAGDVPVAHLTGTAAVRFSDEDVAAAKAFVEGGGVLLVDACGGSSTFYEGVRDGLLEKAFPGQKPQKLAENHPILVPAGEKELLVPKLRAYTAEALKDGAPGLGLMQAGKGYVVVSPLDLTEGLIGANTWGVVGYDPATAQAIVRNVLLWAHATQ
jgi:hypothetical protein